VPGSNILFEVFMKALPGIVERLVIFLQTAGDSHFVQIRVGGKGQQAGVLVFPSEPADAVSAFAFGH